MCLAWALLGAVLSADALEAGAAKVELTPELGTPLDGSLERRGRGATGIHDPLYVRALYLEADGVAVFLVTADLFAISPDLRSRVLALAPSEVPTDHIILVATHVRSGPGGLDRSWFARQRGGRFMPEWLESAARSFSEAMVQAFENRRRGAIGYATTQQRNLTVNRFDPAGPTDVQIGAIRVDDSDGHPIAVLANLAASPETAPASRPLTMSSGYPGAFCAALEEMSPEGMVAFFLNGAHGDQVMGPVENAVGWSRRTKIGETLALRVKALTNDISCRELPLSFSSVEIPGPRSTIDAFVDETMLLQVFEIHRLALCFVPAVPYARVGNRWRKAVLDRGYNRQFTVAPSNGYRGAMPDPAAYPLRDDAGARVFVGPHAADEIGRQFVSLLSRVDATQSDPDTSSIEVAAHEKDGLVHVALSGAPRERGLQRGAALREAIGESPPEAPLLSAVAGLGHWALLGERVDTGRLALPFVADASRGLLAELPKSTMDLLDGMSVSADIPFLTLWLRQIARGVSEDRERVQPVRVLVAGDATEAVVGQSIAWPEAVTPVLAQVKPHRGYAYTGISFPWQAGVLGGMNEKGLVVAVAPGRDAGDRRLRMMPELLVEEVLIKTGSLDEALALLQAPRDHAWGAVFVSGREGKGRGAALIRLGPNPESTRVDDVRSVLSAHEPSESATNPRDARLQKLVKGLDAFDAEDVEWVLTDRDRRAITSDVVFSPHTRAIVVFVPERNEVRVMTPGNGKTGKVQTVRIGGGES